MLALRGALLAAYVCGAGRTSMSTPPPPAPHTSPSTRTTSSTPAPNCACRGARGRIRTRAVLPSGRVQMHSRHQLGPQTQPPSTAGPLPRTRLNGTTNPPESHLRKIISEDSEDGLRTITLPILLGLGTDA